MPKTYRIFPGIGIARVGNSPDSFFLAPEIPGLGPLELTADDSPVTVRHFKVNGLLRRQAARFRIFEFDSDHPGQVNEITATNGVRIEWSVELANEKAAAGRFESENNPESQTRRNPDAAADLIIKPAFAPISGPNQTVTANPDGKFKGQPVYLGELRTDAKGRLMVLGGRGASGSVPDAKPIGAEHNTTHNNFANNAGWHDDVSDGPITATVTIPGQAPQQADGAWVIVAPPDYAPFSNGVATLYDVASQAAGSAPPATPSFQNDIFPILNAATRLRFTSQLPVFGQLSRDWDTLSSKGTPASDQLRQDTLSTLLSLEDNFLAHFFFTDNQKRMLNAWQQGTFVTGFNRNPPVPNLSPDGLDRASLSSGVGGGFFPGIEGGVRMTSPGMYRAPFRIANQAFNFNGVQVTPHPGFITRNMACPWQSDFFECENESLTSVWWPAQRPIEVFPDPSGAQKTWTDSIPNHRALVRDFGKLGLILPGDFSNPEMAEPLAEVDRDPSVPHT